MIKFQRYCLALALIISITSCGSGGQSLEEFKAEFISAGGICASQAPSITTSTTTTADTNGQVDSFQTIEYLNCGEDEASIGLYSSEKSARAGWWAYSALGEGLLISFGLENKEHFQLIKGNFKVALPTENYPKSKVDEIAKKLGAYVLSNQDIAIRKEIFSEVTAGSDNGGLDSVAAACLLKDGLSADGQSIEADTEGEEDSDGDLISSVFCVLRATVAPDYVFESIKNTRSLDGRVEEKYGAYRTSWNYHPDDGLQLSLIFNG